MLAQTNMGDSHQQKLHVCLHEDMQAWIELNCQQRKTNLIISCTCTTATKYCAQVHLLCARRTDPKTIYKMQHSCTPCTSMFIGEKAIPFMPHNTPTPPPKNTTNKHNLCKRTWACLWSCNMLACSHTLLPCPTKATSGITQYLLESIYWKVKLSDSDCMCDDMLVSGFIALNFICWSINKQMTHHNEVLCLSE